MAEPQSTFERFKRFFAPVRSTVKSAFGIGLWLVVLSAIVLWLSYLTFDAIEFVDDEVSVSWDIPEGVVLKAGPVGFRCDYANKRLSYRGKIEQEQKKALYDLFDYDKSAAAVTESVDTQNGEQPQGNDEAKNSDELDDSGDVSNKPTEEEDGDDLNTEKEAADNDETTADTSGLSKASRLLKAKRSYYQAVDALADLSETKSDGDEVSVSWDIPEGVVLKAGPVGFRCDYANKRLSYRGKIDQGHKKVLYDLFDYDESAVAVTESADTNNGEQPPDKDTPTADTSGSSKASRVLKAKRSYYQAVDELADRSVPRIAPLHLMALAGLAAVVGVLLRSLTTYIWNTKTQNDNDAKESFRWWVMRPLLGFLLGLLVVPLFKSGLVSQSEVELSDDIWLWLGLATFVGFGAIDFTERLRNATKAIFGGKSGDVSSRDT